MKPSFYKDPVGLSIYKYLEHRTDNLLTISVSRLESELFGGITSVASTSFWMDAVDTCLMPTGRRHLVDDYLILLGCLLIAMTPQERMEIVDYYFGGSDKRIQNNRSAV